MAFITKNAPVGSTVALSILNNPSTGAAYYTERRYTV